MKLTAKLISVLMAAIIILNVTNGFVAFQREARLFGQDTLAGAHQLGGAMEQMILVVWQQNGHKKVLELIRQASVREHRMRVRWVWFDAEPDDPFFPAASPGQLQTLVIEKRISVEARDPDGTAFLHTYWPIAVPDARQGGLELSRSMSELEQAKRNVVHRTLLQVGATILVAGLVTVLTGVKLVGRPLQRLIEKTRRLGAGDLTGPIDLHSRDELGELAESLNRMCEQVAESQEKIREEAAHRVIAMDQLRHADRLRTVGCLASGMAHELGTPLNVVSGRAGMIGSGKLSDREIIDSVDAIKAETEKMTKTIRQLLDFARRSTPQRTSVDLRQVARETIDLLSVMTEKRHVRLLLGDDDAPLTAMVDVGQIQQVLANLTVNAVEATRGEGTVEISVRRKLARPPGGHEGTQRQYHCISVLDEGEGILPENREHLFEPFFTTKGVSEGTGLGLSISYGIVQEHGGWIHVTSEPGEGSCFSVYLPEEPEP